MVYITRKKKKGNYYLYLEESAWIDGKSQRVWQKYLGPEKKLKDLKISGLLSKHASEVTVESLEFGLSAALRDVAREIDLTGTIDAVAGKSREQGLTLGEYVTIAAINRCVAPCSKSKLGRWFGRDWLSTRYDLDPKVLNAQTYYNHFQRLDAGKITAIELALNRVVVAKFDLDLDALFYDPTNFYTFSRGGRGVHEGRGSTLLQFGHSKENRNGNRLVAFWLACAREGVPLTHETYAGNLQDARVFKGGPPGGEGVDGTTETRGAIPAHLTTRLRDLGRGPGRVTIIFDKGNLSPAGMAAVERAGLGFVASRRNSTHKDLLHHPGEKFTQTTLPLTGKAVLYHETTRRIYGKARRTIATLDPAKQKKDVLKFRANVARRVVEINDYFAERATFQPGEPSRGRGDKWREKAEIEKKVKAMVGRRPFRGVIRVDVTGPARVPVARGGHIRVHASVDLEARARHEETLGRSILFTNRDDWPPEAVIWAYREQYVVEDAFHRMKCPMAIAVRPMYHHADPCIRAHVFTCVLALTLLSLLRLTLARKHVHASYDEILDQLGAVHAVKITAAPNQEAVLKLEQPRGVAAEMVKKLGLGRLVDL